MKATIQYMTFNYVCHMMWWDSVILFGLYMGLLAWIMEWELFAQGKVAILKILNVTND